MYKLIVFDLDGTLVDSKRDIAVSVNFMLGLYGLPELPLDVIETYVGSGAEKLVRRSMGGAAAQLDIGDAIGKFRAHYFNHCLDSTRDFPGIRDMLKRVDSIGIKLSVVTNKPSYICKRMLEGLGLWTFFYPVLGAEDVPAMKPDPSAAMVVSQKTGIAPSEMIMVGDSPIDAAFARNSGMKSILVCYGGIAAVDDILAAGADWTCDSPATLDLLLRKLVG